MQLSIRVAPFPANHRVSVPVPLLRFFHLGGPYEPGLWTRGTPPPHPLAGYRYDCCFFTCKGAQHLQPHCGMWLAVQRGNRHSRVAASDGGNEAATTLLLSALRLPKE